LSPEFSEQALIECTQLAWDDVFTQSLWYDYSCEQIMSDDPDKCDSCGPYQMCFYELGCDSDSTYIDGSPALDTPAAGLNLA